MHMSVVPEYIGIYSLTATYANATACVCDEEGSKVDGLFELQLLCMER